MRSSWAAGPDTCRRGWRAGAPDRWASIIRRLSCGQRERFSGSSDSNFRSCTATPRTCPCPTPALTSRSPSTARASGVIPHRWIAEAARLLRPGGQLIFLTNGVLAMLTIPDEENGAATDRLLRPYFGMHRFEWSDDDSVEFHLPHGEMLALLRQSGFDVEQLLEIQPPDGSRTRYPFVSLEWARRWPGEEVWKARKRRG